MKAFIAELSSIAKVLRSPEAVQSLLYEFEYLDRNTMKSAKKVWETGTSHCLEAVHLAAAIMECKGFPPLVLSLDSADNICHVVYVFHDGRSWGSLGRSREIGLQGRAPVFRSLRDLAWSYFDPYVDDTGRLTGYTLVNLNESGANWRTSEKNVWKSERYIIQTPHKRLVSSELRYKKALREFVKNGHSPQPYWW